MSDGRLRVGVEALPLFEPAPWHRYGPGFTGAPKARATDPDTSHAAAASYAEHAWAQHPILDGALRARGRYGATIHELAAALGPDWTAVMVARRMRELPDAVATDERRESPSGRRCQVWVHRLHLSSGADQRDGEAA